MNEEASLDEFAQQDEQPEREDGWEPVQLQDVASKRSDNVDPQDVDLNRHVGLEHITPNNPSPDWEPLSGLSSTKRRFIAGDILFAKLRPNLEKSAQPEFDGAASTDIFPVVADSKINAKWLLYRLSSQSAFDYARRTSAGTRMPRTSWNLFSNFEFGRPPLPEQRKIATVLHTVNRAIEKTEEVISQLNRLKQGFRQDLLTRGVDEDGEIRPSPTEDDRFVETRQWTIPEQWELKPLSEVCSIQVGYAFKSDWYQDDGEVRVLRGANVGYGKPDWSDTRYLEPERVPEYEEYQLEAGDLIIGMDRPYTNSGFKISRLSESDVPSLLVQRVGRYIPDNLSLDYLHVVLSDWRYQKQVLRRAQGMDIPHISKTDILSPEVPIPSEDEQARIATRYSTVGSRIQKERQLQDRYKRLKRGLMQDLLSGEVRAADKSIEVPDEISQYG